MAQNPTKEFIITVTAPDRPGLVHAVLGFLVEHGANITESQQFSDPLTEGFFMRTQFTVAHDWTTPHILREQFAPRARSFGIDFEIWDAATPFRTLILVSRHLHCLYDLVFRQSTGTLPIEIPLIVSNHTDAQKLAATNDIEFVHLPVTPDTKAGAEQELLRLIDQHRIDLVVLARYMQVLSDDLCHTLSGRAINIHHSFLPSFKGAKPYHQAFDRGVKLVGATAHYVTADLDEGPIIEQDVIRVDHSFTQNLLVAAGRDVEAQVLARAVRWHAQARVLLNEHRTVVFR